MYSKKQRPSWWLLYLSLPIMIGLFLLEMRLSLSDTGHRFVELIIVLIVFGSMSLWLKANRGALIQEDLERWQADQIQSNSLRADSRPISPQSFKILGSNGNLKIQPRQVQQSIYSRLAGWASAISGFFH
jgi:hypothetical protein